MLANELRGRGRTLEIGVGHRAGRAPARGGRRVRWSASTSRRPCSPSSWRRRVGGRRSPWWSRTRHDPVRGRPLRRGRGPSRPAPGAGVEAGRGGTRSRRRFRRACAGLERQVPGPWHELTERFMDRVGRPSFADALDSWQMGAIVEAFADARRPGPGAPPRSPNGSRRRWGSSSIRWRPGCIRGRGRSTRDATRRGCGAPDVGTGALGLLDPPGSRDVAIEWFAFDLA